MTIIKDGFRFMLWPPPHWQETAKATKENLAAMRKARDEKIAAEVRVNEEGHHMRKTIKDQHDQAEKDMMIGYLRAIQMHLEFVAAKPEYRNFKWSQSDPPESPHTHKIAPWHQMSKTEMKRHHMKTRRAIQTYNGRKIIFWKD